MIIDNIEKAIVALPASGPGWKADKELYAGAALELQFIKDAWRNHVAQDEAKYTEDEVGQLFEHVKALVTHFVSRLQERPWAEQQRAEPPRPHRPY